MTNEYHEGRREYHRNRDESAPLVLTLVLFGLGAAFVYVLVNRLHIRLHQVVELLFYFSFSAAVVASVSWHFITLRKRRERHWPHPALQIPQLQDHACVSKAFQENSIVLGYDINRKPWFWPDTIRQMQSILLGLSGSGKTTLLHNVISQDVHRFVRASGNSRRVPLIIFDGKGDQKFLNDVLPEIQAAGRMDQLRILDPSRPDISVRFNPFYSHDDSYEELANAIFESFNLRQDFFHGHQATYLNDLSRVLWHGGKCFNIHDLMVMALDPQVMKEQIQVARQQARSQSGMSQQRILNLEMSAKNLLQSLEDRERVPKIQGLLNALMTFLADDLSTITGAYHNLLTLDEVIDRELILWVSLNTNKNPRAITALGRMLLQHLQLMAGKRYERQREEHSEDAPMVSVILDEFSPFAYGNFAQVLQTARGSHMAFLFSLQSVSQLERVGYGFSADISSAPNTILQMLTRDEDTAQYFQKASSRVPSKRLTMTVETTGFIEKKNRPLGFGSETDIKETRSRDDHVKNLPVGQMEILQTDRRMGTLHSHLHVRRAPRYRLAGTEPTLYPQLQQLNSRTSGANLRFKNLQIVQRNLRIFRRNRLGQE
jgi:GTPase SAR1 family protein